jgi:small subunit ribosomal protein S13
MAEEKGKPTEKKQEKKGKEKKEARREEPNIKAITLVRILSTDIPGDYSLYPGLTRIKGVSWSMSNAICTILNIDKNKKVISLSPEELEKISTFIKNPQVPEFLLNRKKDRETGVSKHLVTTDLDLARDFDIRRMKKIKSYKGWRHSLGQPVRGQRTRSHFRKGGAIGVAKGKARQAPAPTAKEEKKKK